MKSSVKMYILLSLLVFMVTENVHADSIWKKRILLNTNLFNDNRARRIGDIVTVKINEYTAITGTEDSSATNEKSHNISVDTSEFMTNVNKFTGYEPNISADMEHTFQGKGDYESNRNISLELTAVVTEMLANGNMIIEGNREVNVNDEIYNVKLSGIVRPIDISIDNIVQSSSIANANIKLEGKGFLTRSGKRGWMNRVIEVVWPF